jgi:hypothetical protein
MDWPLVRDRPSPNVRALLFSFRGPGSAIGALLGAGAGYVASGGNGFYAGLALGAGVVLGDVVDRLLVARGLASPAWLAWIGRRIRFVLGALALTLGIFLLVSFVLTRQPIVLAGALIAGAAGALLIGMKARAPRPTEGSRHK